MRTIKILTKTGKRVDIEIPKKMITRNIVKTACCHFHQLFGKNEEIRIIVLV